MKQQATTVINVNRVNNAHTTQLDASWKKSNSSVAYTFEIVVTINIAREI